MGRLGSSADGSMGASQIVTPTVSLSTSISTILRRRIDIVRRRSQSGASGCIRGEDMLSGFRQI